jgi:hypothetical protein
MVGAGLVERATGRDARSRQLRLTSAGTDRVTSILAARQATLARAVAALTPTERDTLESLLDKIVGGVTDDRFAALRVCRLCDRGACRDGGHPCPLWHTVPEGAAADG